MSALFGLLAAFVAALALIRLLPLALTRLEAAAVAVVLALTMHAWGAFVFTNLAGYEGAAWLLPILLLVAAGVSLQLSRKARLVSLNIQPWLSCVLWGGGLVGAAALFMLVKHHYLPEADGAFFSAGYTWADLALHMSLASNFAHQPAFSLDFPLFAGLKTSYPFLVDFQSGFLLRGGFGIMAAFFIPNVLMTLAWPVVLIGMLRRVIHRLAPAVWQTMFFLFSGSFAGLLLFLGRASERGWEVWKAIDYSNAGDAYALHFANLINSHLLPQRSYLFGSAVVFVVIWLLWEWRRQLSRRLLLAAGSLIAALPFIHVHSAFVILGLLLAFAVYRVVIERKPLPPLKALWPLAVVVLALPQVWWQLHHAPAGEFLQVHPGWLTPEGESVIIFWWRNAGPGLLLALAAPFVWRKLVDPMARAMFISGAVLFLICNVFQFQPNLWDNMKFLTYAYLFLLIPAGILVTEWLKNRWLIPVAVVVIVSLTGAGLLTVAREYTLTYQFLSAEDRAFARLVQETTAPTDLILTSERHNHPVTTLAGRPILQGYSGWLWSYGIHYQTQAAEGRLMLMGAQPRTSLLLEQHDIRYVAIHVSEVAPYQFNSDYYENAHELVGIVGGWQLYKVRR